MVEAGDIIGPYTLVRTLGRGTFGEVWLAERRSSLLTTQVALKLPLHADFDLDAIRREAQIWQKASGHTNIVPVLDAEIYDGRVVIVSEYVAGGSLADWLAGHFAGGGPRGGRPAPSVETAVAMLRGILDGLHYLHEMGLVHRDLKPANVMIQQGRPRLADFGLTRVLKPDAASTAVAGTPGYMAPEAFRGEYSPATDLWAAGILLHKLLTGLLPYPQRDFYVLQQAITSAAPVPLSDRLPAAMRPILERALAKPAGARFASAREMAEAIGATTASSALRSTVLSRDRPDPKAAARAEQTDRVREPVLPPTFFPILGREREIARLSALIQDPGVRLVTLTGAGGTGKTRLAIEAARELADAFAGAVWFVPLADLSERATVLDSIRSVLGVPSISGVETIEQVTGALSEQPSLLVLDNFEHLAESDADLVKVLVERAAPLTCLVTSRQSLQLPAEVLFEVPPLPLPEAGTSKQTGNTEDNPCARLFLQRAQRARPDFALTSANAPAVAGLCRRLDGIPLAIELAAAWARTLTPVDMLAHLKEILVSRDRSVARHHRSLDTVIGASFDRLPEELRTFATS